MSVFRGVKTSYHQLQSKHGVLRNNSFVSTSIDVRVACKFADKDVESGVQNPKSTRFIQRIHLPAGTKTSLCIYK